MADVDGSAARRDGALVAAHRRRAVEDAVHSGEMEGMTITPEARADADDYVVGRIDSDELIRRARARYGLD